MGETLPFNERNSKEGQMVPHTMGVRKTAKSFFTGYSVLGNRTLLVMAAAFLLGHQLLWGSVTGSISGVVRDTSGAVIPSAEVVAINVETGVQWKLSTDTHGFYSFQALPIGT